MTTSEPVVLSSGAEMRVTGEGASAVVCVNGGGGREVPGTWSAALEWLVRRLAPTLPSLRFVEVRYRVKSWRRLELCVEDARSAIAASETPRTLLVGYSLGGAVAISAAGEAGVVGVLGLAPWIPDRLDLSPLRGRRLSILHGSLDRPLPGVPGVSPASSRRGCERARGLGVDACYTLVRGGLHGIALRSPSGRTVPLPRARRWATLVAGELGRLAGDR
jgi:pimeloyl-ACP methyl ester carboxylesterase